MHCRVSDRGGTDSDTLAFANAVFTSHLFFLLTVNQKRARSSYDAIELGERHTRIALVSHRYHTGITLVSHWYRARTTLAAISTRSLYCHAPPVCLWHATPPFCHSPAAAATTTSSTSLNTPVSHYSLFAKFTTAAATSLAQTSAKYEIVYSHGLELGLI